MTTWRRVREYRDLDLHLRCTFVHYSAITVPKVFSVVFFTLLEGRGFDSHWILRDFFIDLILPAALWPRGPLNL